MVKLWGKKEKLDPAVESFETKEDLYMDKKLIKYDVIGSLAHAKMLKKIGILSSEELSKLTAGLEAILKLIEQEKFIMEIGDEDMHTKIENFLTEKYGEVGQKIHTARSRNDQVLTAVRLYSKDRLENIENKLKILTRSFKNFKKKYGSIAMPGYTHMQKAMPSSIGLWAGSFIASLEDDLIVLQNAIKINDQSPLGSAAGYGTPIQLDRVYTAKLLGFSKVQENFLYCQNSKGKIEAVVLSSLVQIFLTINKFASDILLFTTSEFNFFTIEPGVTTGSSIMPQKRNLDVAELLRSKVHILLGNLTKIVSVSSNLISGYNRDLQDIKRPLIESLEVSMVGLEVTDILLSRLSPNKAVMEKALTEEVYATQRAFDQVKKGVPFRKAYHLVKDKKSKSA